MCTNMEYIQKQVNINDLIYIDTCSLLNTNRLENFINNSKEYFIESNKKIRIHNAVLNELAKFRCSSTLSKKEQAEKALDIIGENKDDIEERYYDGNKEKINLEYPDLIREFDDDYITNYLEEPLKDNINKDMEEIDI